ncbi:glycosyl hydrolase family 18 protein [Paenibacillus paeoniae]|uniref:chitinase n=1 Tax=Paenibacillus paeoniae TaxID=2292705 RepID=A0A371P5M0_9BACL|nr:glycosyl hydrolase family 18 protein [Paenibacillus paeoniae]REK71243.1 hypothetical protein DX130_22635 [Paenibacillus paeoniae]
MVYFAARKKELKMLFIVFLALAVLFSPLLQSITYAADNETPGQTEEQTEPVNESTEPQEEEVNEELAQLALDIPDQDPLAPQNLKIVEGSLAHNKVDVTWDFRADEDDNNIFFYKYIINPATGQYYWKDITWGTFWSRTIPLEPETEYKIMIVWDSDKGELKHKSNIIEFTTPADTDEYKKAPLAAPLNLRLTDISETSATFKWTGSPGADGYDFYPNAGWNGIWDGSNTFVYSFTNADKVPGTTNIFRVAAQNSTEKTASDKSNNISFKWGELQAPKAVQIVTATRTSAALAWAASHGATAYEIYVDDKLAATTNDIRYVLEDLNEGQSYSISVLAKNSLWASEKSSPITLVPGANYTNVSYYTAWARSDTGRDLKPGDVDFSNVTHINYAFADLCWKKITSKAFVCQTDEVPLQSDYVYDGEIVLTDIEFTLKNFEELKPVLANNPDLKLLISVGGWTLSKYFSNMAATEETRRTFAASAVEFVRTYNLNGIDIDWEYPVEGGDDGNTRSPEDNVNFTLLMKTVREALDAAGSEDGEYYLLTIASLQADRFIANADIPNSVQYLDFINIMTYDYSGDWSLLAHHNSPIYYDQNHPAASAARNNVRGGAVGHLNGGVPTHKLVLGVPFYGKGWIGCPEPGEYQMCESIPEGTWKGDKGLFDFNDIQDNYLTKAEYEHFWNPASKVSYVFDKNTGKFISYNDETTMMYTASLVKTLDIAGVMSWDISGDRNNTLIPQLAKDLPIDGVVNTDALKSPQNVKEASVGYEEAAITWDAVAGATSYEVFINHSYVDSTDGAETEASFEGLITGTEYIFNVYAIKQANGKIVEVSPASKNATIKTEGLTPPSNVKVVTRGHNFLDVQWDAAPEVDTYAVYLFDELLEYTTDTHYKFVDLTPGESYDFYIASAALSEDEVTDESTRVGLINVVTRSVAPPANLAVESRSTSSIKVKWDAVTGATDYEVYLNEQLAGTTNNTSYTLSSLSSNTAYTIEVVAIVVKDDSIIDDSLASKIEARTSSPSTPSPGPDTSTNKSELQFSAFEKDGKLVVSVDAGPSIQNITDSNSASFRVTVGQEAKAIEIELPKDVVAALAAKDSTSQLSIIWNGVTYVIPAHALPLGVDLQISITPATSNAATAAEKLAQDSGLKLLVKPLDFKISKYTTDGKLEEITNFGKHSLSRIFTLDAADVNTARATGVIYDPTTNTFRPVPTLFTKPSTDKVRAELKRSGNSIYTIVQSNITYKDATAAWAKDSVARAAAKLLLDGKTTDTFGVSNSITRAEFISVIIKGLGILPENGTAPFQDVAANSKYAGDIAAAKKLGLIQGKSETTFDPDSSISRQDITVILSNVLSHLGVTRTGDIAKLNAFADAKDIAAYAKSAVALAVQEGIMIGKSSTTFDPKADLTRAQAAVIVIRILEAHNLDKV